MSDASDRGITVTEMAPMDQPVDASNETTAAFVGRARRGPLDTPVLVKNLAAFTRRFGDAWPGSGLGAAVEQYFDHGGKQAWVVRVANNARGAMVCLPAVHGVLVLRAVEPGSAEMIRAAVDYDGISTDDAKRFNLTLQRVEPDSGLVLDQEIYRRLTCQPDADRNVDDVLVTSSLVRVQLPLPAERPVPSDADYVDAAEPGSDGLPLSDYDLPPPGAGKVPGPAAVLAAELYCRKRGAMMILDPPVEWQSAYDAIRGTREAGYANPDVISYFPRARIRDDDRSPNIEIGGALAGLLCKLDRALGPWEELDQRGFALHRRYEPAIEIFSSDAHLLVKEGLNVVAGPSPGNTVFCGSVTLAHGTQSGDEFASLTTRRLCLAITNAIDRGTRWAVFEPDPVAARERVVKKIHTFMCTLSDAGAFEDDHFLVQCDAGSQSRPVDAERGITILLAFHPTGSDETITLTLHQSASGFRVSTTAFAPVRAEVA